MHLVNQSVKHVLIQSVSFLSSSDIYEFLYFVNYLIIKLNSWGILRDGTDLRESVMGVFPLSAEDEAMAKAYQDAKYGTFKVSQSVNQAIVRQLATKLGSLAVWQSIT